MSDEIFQSFEDLNNKEFDRIVRRPKARIAELEAKLAELEAIVAKLPHTADGVPVVPGMVVWQEPRLISGKKYPPRKMQANVLMSEDKILSKVEEYRWTYYASDCYSTPQAAEKASQV